MRLAIVESFSTWLKATSLHWFVIHYTWVWPAAETLHFIGLAMLVGVIALIDLRLLGMAKRLPFAPLHRLLPWAIAGFGICLGTGTLFFAGDPFQYIHNNVFWAKLAFILLAGINAGLFYVTDLSSQVDRLGPGDDAPLGAKLVAAASLFLWFSTIFWGRMLPFLGDAF